MKDFSKYKIYIPDSDTCNSGLLLVPDMKINSAVWNEEFIYPFDYGIKILQERKLGLCLFEAGSRKTSWYFKEVYGICAR